MLQAWHPHLLPVEASACGIHVKRPPVEQRPLRLTILRTKPADVPTNLVCRGRYQAKRLWLDLLCAQQLAQAPNAGSSATMDNRHAPVPNLLVPPVGVPQ